MTARRLNFDRATIYGGYIVAVIIMWRLKSFYSQACVQDLFWILKPLAGIVGAMDGMSYAYDAAAGWVRSDGYIIIAPACCGINFLIMVFGLNFIAFSGRLKSFPMRLFWLLISFSVAYGLCLCTNSMRIWASIIFYDNRWHWGWFTPARLHQIIGVMIYFSALGLNYVAMDRIIKNIKFSDSKKAYWKKFYPPWQPLCWYACGTIAVPLLHNIYSGRPKIIDLQYVFIVIVVSSTIWLIALMGRRLFKRKPYATCRFNCGR
jgi:exosortase K